MKHQRTVLWKSKRESSVEYCALYQVDDGFSLSGTVLLALDEQPAFIEYQVTCDAGWRTKNAAIDVQMSDVHYKITLIADSEQRWWHNDKEVVACRGCVDVDLGFTPATNTLPIRRLDFDEASSHDTTATWLRFPELTVEPLPQRYTRLSTGRYCYESFRSGFSADLEVDEQGLVTRYGELWRRIAATPFHL